MKILYLTARFPYPLDKGDKLRDYRHIEGLSANHSVTLVSFVNPQTTEEHLNKLKPYCEKIVTVKKSTILQFLKSLFSIFSNKPLQVSYYKSSAMKKELKNLLENSDFDLLYTHLIRMAQYFIDIKNIPKVIDISDAISKSLSRRIATSNMFMRALIRIERNRVSDYEQQVINDFAIPIVVSEKTKEHLGGNNKIRVIRLGVVKRERPLKNRFPISERPILIFSGNMSYYPNVDAAIYFVREIFPLVTKIFPKAIFKIVGVNPTKNVRKLNSESVIVTGKVPSIRTEMEKADIMVAPMRNGAGTQNKILEAMSSGIPIVTSSIGCEGLGDIDAVPFIVADTEVEFAKELISLLENEELRNNLINSALNFIEEKHSWNLIIDQFESTLLSAVRNNSQGQSYP